MKFYKYGVALALILAVAIAVVGCSKEPLAGEVNGKNITIADVDQRLQQMAGQQAEMFNGPQGEKLKEQFRVNVLDQLIDMELMLQEADKQGIKVSDKAIGAKIKDMMKTYNIKSNKDLEDILKKQKTTMEKFRSEISKLMIIDALGEKITKNVKVSDKDAENYYNTHKIEFATKDQVHVQHILVQKLEDAQKIQKELAGGADFGKLAKQYSIDPGSKDKGGEYPWTDKEKYVPAFGDASWKLTPGQISQPVKTDYGYHIIKLIDKKPAGQRTFAEAKDEIKQKLLSQKKREEFNKWLEGLKKKATIKKYLTAPKTEPTASGLAPSGSDPGSVPAADSGQGQVPSSAPSQPAPQTGQ